MARIQDDRIRVEVDITTEKAREEIHRLTKENEECRASSAAMRKEKARLAELEGDHSAEIKRLNEAIRENDKVIRSNCKQIAAYEKSIDLSKKTANELRKGLRDLQRQQANTSKAMDPQKWKELEQKIKEYKEALKKAETPTRSLWEKFKELPNISKVAEGAFLAIGSAITDYVIGSFKQMVSTITDFEKANSKLASVLGTNLQGITKLTEQAKFLGRTTTATASDVTMLQTELAKLGFVQSDIENLTPSVLKFAKSVDTDLASAAAFAGAAMRMFNKESKDAEEVMATFAIATTSSALDFHKLESSLATVGPVANAFGFTVEETTALLGQLSNAGFDASSAATATRNILLNMADSSGDLAQALGGPVKNLDDLIKGMKKLNSEGIDLAKTLELTDKRSVAAFATFLNGVDNIANLRDTITGCTGKFDEMAATMADNAAASWMGFESAVEGLILKFFDFRETLKMVYTWATNVINWIGSLVDSLSGLFAIVKFLGAVVFDFVEVLALFVGWITKLITQFKYGRAALNAFVVALIACKLATNGTAGALKGMVVGIWSFIKSLGSAIAGIYKATAAMVSQTYATIKAAIAQRTFNAAMLANPILLLVALAATAVAAIIGYYSTVDDATESTDAWNESMQEASKQYGEQKGKIMALVAVAENENISLKRRQQAVAELNRIIPGYNASIDKTTGKYKASKKALDEYLKSLEKEMRYKANESKLAELYAKAEAARDKYDQLLIDKANGKVHKSFRLQWWNSLDGEIEDALKEWEKAEKEVSGFKNRFDKALSEGVIARPSSESDATQTVDKVLDKTEKKGAKVVTRLQEINAELKKLRKMDPTSDEELDRINRRIEALKKEKKELEGKSKTKRETGTYKDDSLEEVIAPENTKHMKNLLEINKKDISESEKIILKNKELIRYNEALVKSLEDMRGKTKSTHKQTLDAIDKKVAELNQETLKAGQDINAELVKQDEKGHKDRMAAMTKFYEDQKQLVTAQTIADADLEKANSIYQLAADRKFHKDQLDELKKYSEEVTNATHYTQEQKLNVIKSTEAEIQKLNSQILTDTGKLSEAIREATADSTSRTGIKKEFDSQIASIEAYYTALEETAEEHAEALGTNAETVAALEEEKLRRIAELNYKYREQMWQLKELTGLSWEDEYDRELEKLENYHTQGLISEEAYQQARLKLGMDNSKKYFDYYAGLSGTMFSAIQDAEIAMSDSKYDVLIQQAKNNGEETSVLEEEKENKKLEIQKRYADVNFAIKASQIVADTAVSIMKAFADLGPVAGGIASALLSATGIAQLLSANAERAKVKNLQPSRTAKSSTTTTETATAQRTLTGYAEGGYTGDGDRYEVAGVVHKGEYVVPKPIMRNPAVIDAVGTIEAIRRNKVLTSGAVVATASRGFADGGFTSGPTQVVVDTAELSAVVKDLKGALNNIRAYVVLKDLNDAQKRLDRAQAPFTR